MNLRKLTWVVSALVMASVLLVPGRSWAVYFPLGPSSDDWGMKYQVEVREINDELLNVSFTLADSGRLKPIYSLTMVAFSQPKQDGGRSYLVQAPIVLKAQPDGKRTGQVEIRRKYADIAKIRVLTLTVDGRHQAAGAAYYDIPLKKFLDKEDQESGTQTAGTTRSKGASPEKETATPRKR